MQSVQEENGPEEGDSEEDSEEGSEEQDAEEAGPSVSQHEIKRHEIRATQSDSEEEDAHDSATSESDHDSNASRRSRAPSPTDSLIAHTASLHLSPPTEDTEYGEHIDTPVSISTRTTGNTNGGEDVDLTSAAVPALSVKERVASDITRNQTRQANKYHAKSRGRKIGRPKGSKAKQDWRVKVDQGSGWE